MFDANQLQPGDAFTLDRSLTGTDSHTTFGPGTSGVIVEVVGEAHEQPAFQNLEGIVLALRMDIGPEDVLYKVNIGDDDDLYVFSSYMAEPEHVYG